MATILIDEKYEHFASYRSDDIIIPRYQYRNTGAASRLTLGHLTLDSGARLV